MAYNQQYTQQQYNQYYQQNQYNQQNTYQQQGSVIPMRPNPSPQQGGFAAMNQLLNQKEQQQYGQPQQQYQQQQYQQQQQYSNNIYQMQRNQLQREQLPQQNQQLQNNQSVVQRHLTQLQGQFKYTIDTKTSSSTEQVILCDLQIGQQQIVPIKMVVSTNNFPSLKPKVYVTIQLKQKFIDHNNWEIVYMPFYQWNSGSSLLELVKAIQQKLTENPPAQDPLLNEINRLKLKLNEENAINQLQNLSVEKVFPNATSQDAFQAILNKNSYKTDIQKQQEYLNFANYNLEVAQRVQELAVVVEGQEQNFEEKKQMLEALSMSYEQQQNQHLKLHQDCQFIKDRFNSAAVLQILDQEITRLQDKTLNDEEQKLQSLSNNDCDQFIKEYFEDKKRLAALQIKKDKYTEII